MMVDWMVDMKADEMAAMMADRWVELMDAT